VHNKLAQFDLEDRYRYHTGSGGAKFVHAITSKLSLGFSQPDSPCDGRRIRYGNEGKQALADRDRASNDEQPHPARQAVNSVHVAVQSCRMPRNIAPATSLTLKKARRIASSDGLYQLKIKATTLGQKLAESKPRKKRSA